MGFGKDGKGTIILQENTITLLTLADNTALLADGNITLGEDFRILKTEYFATITSGLAEGPIYFGMANGELSIAEIAEALIQTGPLNRNDAARTEQALRQIKLLEVFGPSSDTSGPGGSRKGTWNPRWTYSSPEGWNFFAFNQSGGAVTTGDVIHFRAKHFGVWVT